MILKRAWYKLTHWEQWHYNVKYILLSPVWIWYSIRAKSFYFFTPANPTLTFGGFEGGPKKEIYELLPSGTYPKSIYIDPNWTIQQVESNLDQANLNYPIAAKPNIGMMGLLFRKINNIEELNLYHQTVTVTYILQEFISYPLEVSVFYYRIPNEEKGHITGFVRKEPLEVTGDGKATLEILMLQLANRPGFNYEEWKIKHAKRLQEVIPAGQVFQLSWVANLSRGARLVSLEGQKDDQLLRVFDRISHTAKNLFYGRYDIKCTSIDDLKKGTNFCILEFNGTGAEPHHMYGNGNHFIQAAKIIIQHWRMLYSIAVYNHQKGIKYKSLLEGIQFTRRSNKHFNYLRKLDKEMPFFH